MSKRNNAFRVVIAAAAALFLCTGHAQTAPAPEAGAGTAAWQLSWPAYVAGDPPALHIDGGGLLQLLILAPEVLEVIQGSAKGQDMKAKAAQLAAIIEQSKGEAGDPGVICAEQTARITELQEQLADAQEAATAAQALAAEAVGRASAAEAVAGAAEGKASAAEAKAAAAEAQAAQAQAGANACIEARRADVARITGVRGAIGTAAEALKTASEALADPVVTD